MRPEDAYQWLLEHSTETSIYESMKSLLGWDQRTCLPKRGNYHRSRQIATITGLIHRRQTDPRTGEMLFAVEGSEFVQSFPDAAANTREWKRSYERATRRPESLVVELARAETDGELAWQTRRPDNDWRGFLPYLERIVDLKREEAAVLSNGGELYDALIEDFEPGETAKSIEPVFKRLGEETVRLLEWIGSATVTPDLSVLRGDSPVEAQLKLIDEVVRLVGYDLDGGRIDRSAHPFSSTIGPGDVRITTRFDLESFVSALFGSIHEAGHALYEQGLPAAHWGTPRGGAASMAVHESQSRVWENMVARSQGFWKYMYPIATNHFSWLGRTDPDRFLFALNDVRPSLIRTESDEVTYNLHIIMRFELERALIGRDLEPKDLPEAWNARMRKYFGLTPPDYSSGVMQDVHWPGGAFGYFPSYALGNIYAAQFFATAQDRLGDLDKMFEAGEFAPFLNWLRENVHAQGWLYMPRDLVRKATGEDLNPDYLIDYLKGKYARLYGLG